jgi:hypothetical protein
MMLTDNIILMLTADDAAIHSKSHYYQSANADVIVNPNGTKSSIGRLSLPNMSCSWFFIYLREK